MCGRTLNMLAYRFLSKHYYTGNTPVTIWQRAYLQHFSCRLPYGEDLDKYITEVTREETVEWSCKRYNSTDVVFTGFLRFYENIQTICRQRAERTICCIICQEFQSLDDRAKTLSSNSGFSVGITRTPSAACASNSYSPPRWTSYHVIMGIK